MIVPMKKLTLLVSARDRRSALDDLRKLGVLHVQHIKRHGDFRIFHNQLLKYQFHGKALVLEGFDHISTDPLQKIFKSFIFIHMNSKYYCVNKQADNILE